MRDSFKTATYYRLFAYFVPLALQVSLQSLTYPLVATIAAKAEGGALNTAGMAQSSAIVNLLWAFGNGLITSGMIYARTREGFQRFKQVYLWILLTVSVIYFTMVIPPVSRLIFNELLGLPMSVATPAKQALLFSYPMTALFFLRTPYFVILYTRGVTIPIFIAALIRVLLTMALTVVFAKLGATGVFWAVFCLTLPILGETGFLKYIADRNLPYMPPGDIVPRRREILSFSLTLSMGSAMLAFSGFMLGAFISRAADPERMLQVYYLVLAAVNTLASGVVRIQTTTLAFYDKTKATNRMVLIFALIAGFCMGTLHLFLLPHRVLTWYYVDLQGLDIINLPLVKITSWGMALFAPAAAFRSYAEGLAACHKKPMLVITGQAVYLAMVAVFAFFALNLHVPGNLIAPIALFIANTLGALAILHAIRWDRRRDLPVPETHMAQGIRQP